MNMLSRERIRPGLENSFAGVSRQIFQNWRTLESGNRDSCVWLSSRIDQLHRELSTAPDFCSKVWRTDDLAAGSKPYHWIPLVEHDNCRSGLLYLPPGGRIAMHDHPHSIGVSIVLDGTPLISQSDRVSGCRYSFTPLAQKKISRTRLQPHQKSFIFPQKNNMHGFSSSGSSCLLLNSVFQKKAMHHHSLLPGQLINRSFSGEHLFSTLQKSLTAICLSMSLSLPASVYADEASLSVDTATAALAAISFDTLERYALDGNVEAQASLAVRYSSGEGVQKDLYRAGIWYRRAAEGGCAEAQYRIGVMLIDGEGMTEDSNEGLEWIFRASQADHAKATSVFNYLMANPVALDC
jgi:hypothetical protein